MKIFYFIFSFIFFIQNFPYTSSFNFHSLPQISTRSLYSPYKNKYYFNLKSYQVNQINESLIEKNINSDIKLKQNLTNNIKNKKKHIKKLIFSISIPMILTLLTEPIASLTSSFSVKKFSSLQQASIGFALSSISSIIKIFSDPLLNCSTSFIASCYNNNKSYHELLIAVLISLVSAFFLGMTEI